MLHGKMKGATPSHDTESLYRIFVGTVRVKGCSSRMPFFTQLGGRAEPLRSAKQKIEGWTTFLLGREKSVKEALSLAVSQKHKELIFFGNRDAVKEGN